MAAGISALWRSANLTRLLVVLFLITGAVWFRDLWLPHGYSIAPRPPDAATKQPNQLHQPDAHLPDTVLDDGPAMGDTSPADAPPTTTTAAGGVFGDWRKQRPEPAPTPTALIDPDELQVNASCDAVPGADRVMVLMKTGATEIYQKLPTHFVTTFQCTPHYMIFSDLAQTFADVRIYDAIGPVTDNIRVGLEDFDLYRLLNRWHQEGQDFAELKGDRGWNLDKWKFLPMLHMAFSAASPDIDWFVMMEADSILSWTNLLQYLKRMDPTKPIYAGAQNVLGDTLFAHGGSGIVISRAAALLLKKTRDEMGHHTYDTKWEEKTRASCCGDGIVAEAFLDIGVPLTLAWPLIQGETVKTVDWTSNHWCAPPITWHHVTPIELDTMWQFEQDWVAENGWDTPYLYRDVFATFAEPLLRRTRNKWDNLSKDRRLVSADLAGDGDEDFTKLQDWEKQAAGSQAACIEACERLAQEELCLQWKYSPGRCHLGRDVRIGHSDEHANDHWTSGWLVERIKEHQAGLEGCDVRWAG